MVGPMDENDFALWLPVFVAGELESAPHQAMLSYVADHPEALQQVADELRLRAALAKPLQTAPPPSESLRRRIEALARDKPDPASGVAAAPDASVRNPRRPLFFSASLAAIVLLAGGALLGWFLARPLTAAAAPVPPALVARVTDVHIDCSRFADALHAGPFPQERGDMAEQLKRDLHLVVPYPDLSSLGYDYVGAGPCADPISQTVHLLYRSHGEKFRDTVSLFVQPYAGQVRLEAGKVYVAAAAGHPMLVWRSDQLVYFLVGDDMEPVQKALKVIQSPSPDVKAAPSR